MNEGNSLLLANLAQTITTAIEELYQATPDNSLIQFQRTRKEFEGDWTFVAFPLSRLSKKAPNQTAKEIGEYLATHSKWIERYHVVQGFLNLSITSAYWLKRTEAMVKAPQYGITKPTEDSTLIMVEYSSPNTNKPLHLGHVRNNLLGFSLCQILEASGKRVIKTNLVNDRGIHICKSIHAWMQWGNGETPESSGKKGDHLVGKYYVEFDKRLRQETAKLNVTDKLDENTAEQTASMMAAREILRKWEQKDPEIYKIWETMNGWVYKGFEETYQRLGVSFDKIYYESETYLNGKDKVLEGLKKGIFYRKEDSSIWADLTAEGLDHKLLLRSDETSVYITQDIGTAAVRYEDYPIDQMVYVVGNEQNYHFQVLAILLDRLGYSWGKGICHFSYGMVELPKGRMKSREGTVVDADDLIDGMITEAEALSKELGKLDEYTAEEQKETHRMVGLGALKYYILKVDPKKNMLFNPEESIDFNGNTGPFIQYTHARICSVLRKANKQEAKITQLPQSLFSLPLFPLERTLIKRLDEFPEVVQEAASTLSPALIAKYCYDLAKEYNQFYHDHSILNEKQAEQRQLRLMLTRLSSQILKSGLSLLGIEAPERM